MCVCRPIDQTHITVRMRMYAPYEVLHSNRQALEEEWQKSRSRHVIQPLIWQLDAQKDRVQQQIPLLYQHLQRQHQQLQPVPQVYQDVLGQLQMMIPDIRLKEQESFRQYFGEQFM